jgi:uncharacterized protein YycO
MAKYQICPPGIAATDPQPGDFILLHRKGPVSRMIQWSERIRFKDWSTWSHAAFIENSTTLIEALTEGVCRGPISKYKNTMYILVHTEMQGDDQLQAVRFAQHQVGLKYGFLTDLGIFMRFLTPGRGLWFGTTGTEICSGLVAQAMTRGWEIFEVTPGSISPAELAQHYNVPTSESRL